jgi:hypothetical protein
MLGLQPNQTVGIAYAMLAAPLIVQKHALQFTTCSALLL